MCIRPSLNKSKAVLAAFALLSLLPCSQAFAARNVILMIGDGMGFGQVTAGSYYLNGTNNSLAFSPYYKCSVTTNSLTTTEATDSAAAATALATGHKVLNGLISQDATREYQTILEIAKAAGKRTGLVGTDPITRATPAAFGGHDLSRYAYTAIGNDYLNSSRPDVLFGGSGTSPTTGEVFFTPAQVSTAVSIGYTNVTDLAGMSALDPSTVDKALGTFNQGVFPFEYDTYPSTLPHLSQMTSKALDILNVDPDGFFLMVEGAKIDYASHPDGFTNTATNRTKYTTKEVLAFNDSVQVVLNWMAGRTDTLLIVTGDHETGGMTVTRNNGVGNYASASWSTTSHTTANVPLYVAGNQSGLADKYIASGKTDNTKVFELMNEAFNTPVPEPGTLLSLLCGFGGTGILMTLRKKR